MKEFIKWLRGLKTSTLLLLGFFFVLLPTFLNHYEGATGTLLVAEPQVRPPFNQTVLYIREHTLGHANGFIINVPINPQDVDFDIRPEWEGKALHYGGPVGFPDEAVFYAYKNQTDAMTITTEMKGEPDFIILGYAGWTVMQLNYEILRKNWHTIDYDPALVFDMNPSLIWDHARRRVIEKVGVGDRDAF